MPQQFQAESLAEAFTNLAEGRRFLLAQASRGRQALAATVILDPVPTLSQPPLVAACTGMDALAHAVETAVTEAGVDPADIDSIDRRMERHLRSAREDDPERAIRAALDLRAARALAGGRVAPHARLPGLLRLRAGNRLGP